MKYTPFDYKNNFNASKEQHYENWRIIDGGFTQEEIEQQRYEQECINAVHDAVTPMEVIEAAMRMALRDNDYKRAAIYAEKLLPYKAPRLSAIATTEVKRAGRVMSFDDLDLSELQALHRVAVAQIETKH